MKLTPESVWGIDEKEKLALGQTGLPDLIKENIPAEILELYKEELKSQVGLLEGLGSSMFEKKLATEFEQYKVFARTGEAIELIKNNFFTKLKRICMLPELSARLETLYQLLSQNIKYELKITICAGLAYFILPMDLIPDYLFPIGFLDDSIVIALVWRQISNALK